MSGPLVSSGSGFSDPSLGVTGGKGSENEDWGDCGNERRPIRTIRYIKEGKSIHYSMIFGYIFECL